MTVQMIAKRMLFLAYQSALVVGMGQFQARDGVTEEEVWASAAVNDNRVYSDYCFGRMMKFRVSITANNVQFDEGELHHDYQSWCGKYSTYQELYDAAIKSLS